jgi:hypothetical protein
MFLLYHLFRLLFLTKFGRAHKASRAGGQAKNLMFALMLPVLEMTLPEDLLLTVIFPRSPG